MKMKLDGQSWSLLSLCLKYHHIVFVPKIPWFLTTCVPILPLLLFLLVYLLHLSIFMSEFQCLNLVLFVLFYIFRIIRHYLQLIRNFELLIRVNFLLFLLFLIWIAHRPQSMKFNYFLSTISLIPHLISLFQHFFNNTWIKFSICWVNSFAMSSLLK